MDNHWQFPAGAVIADSEAVPDPQMWAERRRAKPALETNHIILLDRATDPHRRSRRLLRQCGTLNTGKGAMHLANDSCELVGRDLVMPHIAGDDGGDPIDVDPPRRFLFHDFVPPVF